MGSSSNILTVAMTGLILAGAPSPALSASVSFTGTVTRVIDGDSVIIQPGISFPDSLTLRHSDTQTAAKRLRLAEIDAPEMHQPFGPEAKAALEAMVLGKRVVVAYKDRDRYGRIIGTLYLDGVSVNLRLVAAGAAWHFRKYSKSAVLRQAERRARTAARGLWRSRPTVAPWEFRSTGRIGTR